MRTFELLTHAFRRLAPLTVLVFLLSGCGSSPTDPASGGVTASAIRAEVDAAGSPGDRPPASLFYPLEVGNHWGYDHSLAAYIIPTGGSPGPVFGSNNRVIHDLVCVEHRLGRSYTVEQVQYEGTPPWWVRDRQDGSGLFEADVDVTLPPACGNAGGRRVFDAGAAPVRPGEGEWLSLAAKIADPAKQAAYRVAWERVQVRAAAIRQAIGFTARALPRAEVGAESGEITRLEYPLHPGARWVIRADPRFESIVEGAEVLDLAVGHVPGWRIRIDSEFLGPDDRVHAWYGPSGYLKLVAHLEGIATDNAGNIIGRVIADESEVLTELSLGGGRFAAP
jgi:hypothetical protein